MANENYDRSRGNTGRSSTSESGSKNSGNSGSQRNKNNSARDRQEQAKKKKWAENARVLVGTISNAIVPGSGAIMGPIGAKIGEQLATGEVGTTPEQREKRRLATRHNKPDRGYKPTRQTEVEAVAPETEPLPPITDEGEATRVADAAKKKKRKGIKTVLTSPLGATETAKTAVAKLGGY